MGRKRTSVIAGCAPLISCPTDKGLILGEQSLQLSRKEGRREYGKNRVLSKRKTGKEGMSSAGERRSWEIGVFGAGWAQGSGDNSALGMKRGWEVYRTPEVSGWVERPRSCINEVPSNPCISSSEYPFEVLARYLHAILLQWDKHHVGGIFTIPKSIRV